MEPEHYLAQSLHFPLSCQSDTKKRLGRLVQGGVLFNSSIPGFYRNTSAGYKQCVGTSYPYYNAEKFDTCRFQMESAHPAVFNTTLTLFNSVLEFGGLLLCVFFKASSPVLRHSDFIIFAA